MEEWEISKPAIYEFHRPKMTKSLFHINTYPRIFITLTALLFSFGICLPRRITGEVVESQTTSPIGGVIVKCKHQGKILGYCVSKSNGSYSVEIPDSVHTDVMIEFSAHGYQTVFMSDGKLSDDNIIKLMPQAEDLEEIVVRPLAVVAKGDTLIYNVDAVRNVADRSIEDVIAHLPGVEVSNGQIIYNGEPINKFYVEGLDALGGNYSTASQNIRAEDVSSINVYENHEPKAVLRDMSMSKQAALNIKLKSRSALRPSGYISGGIGKGDNEITWLGKAFGMLIAPASQTYIEAACNNFGISPGNGGSVPASIQTPVEHLLQLHTLGNPNIQSQLYQNSKRASSSLNFAFKCGLYSTLRLSAGYGFRRIESTGESLTIYPLSNGDSGYSMGQTGKNISRSQSVNLNISYENNSPHLYLLNDFKSGMAFSRRLSELTANPGGKVLQTLNTNDIALTDNLNIVSRHDSHIWEGNININFHDLPLNRLHAINADNDGLIVDQSARAMAFSINASTQFGWMIGNVSTLGLKLKLNENYTRVNTMGHEGPDFDVIGKNTPRGNQVIAGAGPFYKLVLPKFKFEAGFPFQIIYQDYKSLSNAIDYKKGLMHFAPYLDMNLWLPKEVKGSLNFSFSRSRTGLENFITNPIATSYRTIIAPGTGSPALMSLYKIDTGWSWRKIAAGFFTSMSAGFQSMSNDRMRSMTITESNAATEYVDVKNSTKRFYAILNVSQLVLGQKGTIKLDVSFSRMTGTTMRNGDVLSMRNSDLSAALSFTAPLLSDHLVIKPTAVMNDTRQHSASNFSNTFITWQGLLPVTVLPSRHFDITLTPDFRSNPLSGGNRINTFILNANARYAIKKWEFELHLNNITDRRSYAVETYSDLIYTSCRIDMCGFEALLTARYNF